MTRIVADFFKIIPIFRIYPCHLRHPCSPLFYIELTLHYITYFYNPLTPIFQGEFVRKHFDIYSA